MQTGARSVCLDDPREDYKAHLWYTAKLLLILVLKKKHKGIALQRKLHFLRFFYLSKFGVWCLFFHVTFGVFILKVFFTAKTMLTNSSHGVWSHPMAPSSEATLGLPLCNRCLQSQRRVGPGKSGRPLPFWHVGIRDTCGIDP